VENNTHIATVHIRAGEHHYLFEVNGVLYVAEEQTLMSLSPGSAPASIVNSVLVDDGSEYELGEAAAARPGSPTHVDDSCTSADGFSTVVPINLKASWSEPPAVPPHLAQLHGVQTAVPRHACWQEGRPHAVFPDCKLNHATFTRCGMTISVTSRWREHRVTDVLLKPTPARTAPLAITSLRTTLLASAAISIPQLSAAPLRCVHNDESDETIKQSDESMGESDDSSVPSSPTEPTLAPFSWTATDFGAVLMDDD
jgi:hypothetical protein